MSRLLSLFLRNSLWTPTFRFRLLVAPQSLLGSFLHSLELLQVDKAMNFLDQKLLNYEYMKFIYLNCGMKK